MEKIIGSNKYKTAFEEIKAVLQKHSLEMDIQGRVFFINNKGHHIQIISDNQDEVIEIDNIEREVQFYLR